MRKLAGGLLLVFALALAAAPAGAAAAVAPPSAPAAEPSEQAMAVARLRTPPDLVRKMTVRIFERGLRDVMGKDPDMELLLAEKPRLIDDLVVEVRPILLASVDRDMPFMLRSYALFFQQHFTPAELGQLTSFLRSPAGQKLVERMFEAVDVSSLMAKIASDDEAKVAASDISDMATSAATRSIASLDQGHAEQFHAFVRSPLGLKLASLTDAFAKLEAELANQEDPELDRQLDEALNRYFAKEFPVTDPSAR